MPTAAPRPSRAGPLRAPAPRPRVLVVAPSSPFEPARLERGRARLAAAGFDVEASDLLVGDHAYLNGSDEERAAALAAALARDDVDVVWLARGGYGLTRLLDRLPELAGPVPAVVGFSDATALLAWLHRRGIPSVHGPLATTVADEDEASFAHLHRLLSGSITGASLAFAAPHGAADGGTSGVAGAAEGPLFVANLCVLTHLVGTPWFPDLDGHLLVFEEVGERPYRIDRMLTQLLGARALEGVAGVVVGHLTGCAETGAGVAGRAPAPSATEVILERLAPLGVPIGLGAPVGHAMPNYALPVGRRARLEVGPARSSLTLLEELVAG